MKVRSKALYAYLLDAGVLNGTSEEIDMVKRDYRRLYKKQWKQIKRQRKEIRIEVTIQQFEAIKAKAQEHKQAHTTYARVLILSAVESKQFIPHQDQLLKALQLVSMATNATERHTAPIHEVFVMLEQAEAILLKYLKD